MKKNEGTIDRAIRAVVGIMIMLIGFTMLSGWAEIIAYIIGLIAIFTSISGFCLVYKIFGINTNKKNENEPKQ